MIPPSFIFHVIDHLDCDFDPAICNEDNVEYHGPTFVGALHRMGTQPQRTRSSSLQGDIYCGNRQGAEDMRLKDDWRILKPSWL
jgi:hypothetical protein